tara:strand:+ start:37 stop:153 length:117 start_codon:yes stop_codon:yes gene_type:complete
MKILCSAGIEKIMYINDYRNDELVDYFSEIGNVKIIKL